jgi:adenylate kinase family enzyme
MTTTELPKIIILYGPPAAGKGTQAHLLKSRLPDYYHLDFGSELRKFVLDALGNYTDQDETIQNPNIDPIILETARRIKSDMKQSLPVKTPDLRFVIEKTINDCVNEGKGMIIEGPGRLVEEAQWLSGFLGSKGVSVAIFHLYIALDEVLKRATTRYYLPSSKKPYVSLQEAQADAKGDEKPYRRAEDEDVEGTKQRYRLLYSDNFAKIISIYQLQAKSLVFTVDARETIDEVSETISAYFEKFYATTV